METKQLTATIERPARRRVLTAFTSLAAASGLVKSLTPSATAAAGQTPQPATVLPNSSGAPKYLNPSYLPTGYHLRNELTNDVSGGFGGGELERISLYVRAAHTYERPLLLAETPAPKKRYLSGTKDHTGTPMTLHVRSGATIRATYHDGAWMLNPQGEKLNGDGTRMHWDTSDLHSLLFATGPLTIGLRGSRAAGVDLDELVRIAESLQ